MINAEEFLSIYVHIPFCAHMCSYCAFNTYVNLDELIPDFVSALETEIRYVAQTNPGYAVHTIYLGGGTPSLLAPEYLDRILSTIHSSFRIVNNNETTIECNPNNITNEYARALKDIGFNRISIGMQSADTGLLSIYKRDHNIHEVEKAVSNLQKARIENISIDLIFGGPGETLESWKKTIETAISFNPKHLSLYNLMLKGNTELTKKVEKRELKAPDDDTDADMYDHATKFLKDQGYTQYEISNWCVAGYESQHNLQYWRNLNYLGLGPGAHGSAKKIRTIVRKHPAKYIESLQNTAVTKEFPITPATAKFTRTKEKDEIIETIIMGMRLTQEGISKKQFKKRFKIEITELYEDAITRHKQNNLLEETNDIIRLTEKGRMLSNAVLRDFI